MGSRSSGSTSERGSRLGHAQVAISALARSVQELDRGRSPVTADGCRSRPAPRESLVRQTCRARGCRGPALRRALQPAANPSAAIRATAVRATSSQRRPQAPTVALQHAGSMPPDHTPRPRPQPLDHGVLLRLLRSTMRRTRGASVFELMDAMRRALARRYLEEDRFAAIEISYLARISIQTRFIAHFALDRHHARGLSARRKPGMSRPPARSCRRDPLAHVLQARGPSPQRRTRPTLPARDEPGRSGWPRMADNGLLSVRAISSRCGTGEPIHDSRRRSRRRWAAARLLAFPARARAMAAGRTPGRRVAKSPR